MTTLGRYSFRWQAYKWGLEKWKGAVAYEFAMVDGAPKELPFEPRVEYHPANEPKPWTVVF